MKNIANNTNVVHTNELSVNVLNEGSLKPNIYINVKNANILDNIPIYRGIYNVNFFITD